MVMDKNYFLTRLANGEDMNVIGTEIAAMMNEAMAEYDAQMKAEAAKQAEMEKEAAKRDLIEEMVEIIQELAILEGMDEDELAITDDEIDQLVAAFTEMFTAMRELKKMFGAIEAQVKAPAQVQCGETKITPVELTDEQILADFIKMFN